MTNSDVTNSAAHRSDCSILFMSHSWDLPVSSCQLRVPFNITAVDVGQSTFSGFPLTSSIFVAERCTVICCQQFNGKWSLDSRLPSTSSISVYTLVSCLSILFMLYNHYALLFIRHSPVMDVGLPWSDRCNADNAVSLLMLPRHRDGTSHNF